MADVPDPRFPRSAKYNPDWVLAGVSGAANPLWMIEWLSGSLDLQTGMPVLDLGCGRAQSSIFLHREFGVQVWAAGLWFDAAENLRRIVDAGAADGVISIRSDARSLPFAAGLTVGSASNVNPWSSYTYALPPGLSRASNKVTSAPRACKRAPGQPRRFPSPIWYKR